MQQKRLDKILKLTNERGYITNAELVELLDSSESTIRRDLTLLEKNNQLRRVHGGATSLERFYKYDVDIQVRQEQNIDEKRVIAQYAARLIQPNDIVFIDAGSTTEMMIEFITETNAVYVTNAYAQVKKLAEKGLEAYIIGGRYKPASEANVGQQTMLELGRYNFTIGFLGANGIDVVNGYSTPEMKEAAVKQKVVEQCERCYVLMDSGKLEHSSNINFAKLSEATLITTKIQNETLKKLKNIIEIENIHTEESDESD